MNWAGTLATGSGWFSFRGDCADNSMHAHATLQVTFAHTETVAVTAANSGRVEGRAVLVRSSVRHSLEPATDVFLALFEPQSRIAHYLNDVAPAGDVVPLPHQLVDLLLRDCKQELSFRALSEAAAMLPAPQIDARLKEVLRILTSIEGPQPMARAAAAVGLSTARLRTLAKQELGWPLADWYAWRRLEKAVLSLRSGSNLASAAADAGFADQAHLTKAMRRLLGITPGTLNGVLKKGPVQAKTTRLSRRV
jgi:AraC-like DNA-binding protein